MIIEFVTFEIAKKLKEKGFKEKCFAYYHPGSAELFFNHIPYKGGIVADCMYSYNELPVESYISDLIDAPTISWALQWLREEKKIYVVVTPYPSISTKDNVVWCYQIKLKNDGACMETMDGLESYMHYRDAALAGIEYVLCYLI